MARWGGQAGPCAGDDHLRECVTGSSTRPMALTTGQSSGHGSGGARTPGAGAVRGRRVRGRVQTGALAGAG